MKNTNRVTSQQIAEAMRVFGGAIQKLPPEVQLQRSSVGFHPNQIAFEEVAGIGNVRVEMMEKEEKTSGEPARSGTFPLG